MSKKYVVIILLTAISLGVVVRKVVARQEATGLSPFQRAKAEQILATRLPCLGCHILEETGGQLGPELTTVGARLSRNEILRQVAFPRERNPLSAMPRVEMPPEWRELVVSYLAEQGIEQASRVEAPPLFEDTFSAPAASGLDGPSLYGRYCAACHGASGSGDGPNATFLPVAPARHSEKNEMGARSDDMLFDAIHGGGYIMNLHPFMPAYGATLSATDIRLLVRHIRVLCECEGPAWSRDGASGVRR